MFKTILFLTVLGLIQAAQGRSAGYPNALLDVDSCEYLDNGCPADYNLNLLLPHETSCRKFYYCVHGEKVLTKCASGTVFDFPTQSCAFTSDRTSCEDDDSSSEEEAVSEESVEIERLPNGCPADFSYSGYLPHEYYCNVYYQCNFGSKIERYCAYGTHFNPETENCDFVGVVGCLLPGGDYVVPSTTTPPPVTLPVGPTAPADLLPNGCPVDGTIDWLVPHEDCSQFYFCVWGSLVASHCPSGLHFSYELQRCESPYIAGCICNSKDCSGESDNNVSSSEEDLPAADAPSAPSSEEDDLPAGDAPSAPSSEEDDLPAGDAPSAPSSEEDDLPAGDAPSAPSSEEDDLPAGDAPSAPSSEEDLPAGDAPSAPSSEEDDLPAGDAPTAPSSEEDDLPAGDAPSAPSSEEDLPAGDAPSAPSSEEDDLPVGGQSVEDDAGNDTVEASSEEDLPADEADCPTPVDPQQKCEEECNVLPWAHGDCDKYWKCDGKQAVLVVCSEGLHFNPNTYTCDFACNVGCVRETIQTTSGPDGIRVYLPWSQINSRTSELLKLIAH